jgi:hypothetical protein
VTAYSNGRTGRNGLASGLAIAGIFWCLVALVLLVVGCSSSAPTPAPTITAVSRPQDPYVEFLSRAKTLGIDVPADLDATSAQARALLGCGTTWAPNTLDRLLADAYATQVAQAKAAGHCG